MTTKNLHLLKGYSATKLRHEFQDKGIQQVEIFSQNSIISAELYVYDTSQ